MSALGRAEILALIPHAGAMCLLDTVVAWDSGRIHCRSGSHRRPDHPLRGPGGLRALHLCEYGAQAMAVHGGLLARSEGGCARPGLLVLLREVRLELDWLDALDDDLEVVAERLLASDSGWLYAFRASHRATLLAEGRATVMVQESPA